MGTKISPRSNLVPQVRGESVILPLGSPEDSWSRRKVL